MEVRELGDEEGGRERNGGTEVKIKVLGGDRRGDNENKGMGECANALRKK